MHKVLDALVDLNCLFGRYNSERMDFLNKNSACVTE